MSATRPRAGDMSTADRWYDDPDTAAILAQPDSTYAADLAARNDALFARVRALTATVAPTSEPQIITCAICREKVYQVPLPNGLCTYCHEDFVEYREPPTELDPLGVAGDDDEPVILPCADDWLESYAGRDYLPEAEQ